jgi:GMP synthase-like glutamine amidotransferase
MLGGLSITQANYIDPLLFSKSVVLPRHVHANCHYPDAQIWKNQKVKPSDGTAPIAFCMRVQILQHLPFEGLGSIEQWLQERDAHVEHTRFYESAVLPGVARLDLVIALGGSMSVNDRLEFPWLMAETQFLSEAIQGGVAVLGICLGAQLVASVLGARVYKNAQKEIGWFDVEATVVEGGVVRLPASMRVFHWHGETFDLPPGAIHLAKSVACQNQAFQWGSTVIALQFHLETTPNLLDALVVNCRDELAESKYVQSESRIRGASSEDFENINLVMAQVLTYLTDR